MLVGAVGFRGGKNAPTSWKPQEGLELIGTPAPPWENLTHWMNSSPLTLNELRGKVVLVRFWLGGCPFCTQSAPALQALYEKYADDGFVVLGIHHPKGPGQDDPDYVREASKDLGFTFPVALDNDWTTIKRYWLGNRDRRYTSSSFLIDQEGIIRFVHDGGEFHRSGDPDHQDCNSAYHALEQSIRSLLNLPTK